MTTAQPKRLSFGAAVATGSGEAVPLQPVIAWLLREGRFLGDNSLLFGQFCDRLAAAGVPLDRATLHLRALHPEYRGVARIWRPGEPLDVRFMDHGIENTATYIESPVRAVAIQGFGEAHLPVPTGLGVRELQNRRVEIIISLSL